MFDKVSAKHQSGGLWARSQLVLNQPETTEDDFLRYQLCEFRFKTNKMPQALSVKTSTTHPAPPHGRNPPVLGQALCMPALHTGPDCFTG